MAATTPKSHQRRCVAEGELLGWVELLARSRGTIVAVTTEPLRAVRDRLSEFVERVEHEHERVMITRNGRPAEYWSAPTTSRRWRRRWSS